MYGYVSIPAAIPNSGGGICIDRKWFSSRKVSKEMAAEVRAFRAYVGKHMMSARRMLQDVVVRLAGDFDFIDYVTSNLALTPLQPEVSLHELTKTAHTVHGCPYNVSFMSALEAHKCGATEKQRRKRKGERQRADRSFWR